MKAEEMINIIQGIAEESGLSFDAAQNLIMTLGIVCYRRGFYPDERHDKKPTEE